MSIHLAVATLQQYKLCKKTKELCSNYPFELKRRITYIDNLILQLNHAISKRNLQGLCLIAEDIRHCLLQNYYPLLPYEKLSNDYNFIRILEDVVQLLELDAEEIAAA